MYAQVTEIPGTVSEISEFLPQGLTAEQKPKWYSCGAQVAVGWSFDGNSFLLPPTALTAPTAPTAQQILVGEAQVALTKSDITVVRCVAAQPPVAVPPALTTYRAALRAIVNDTDTISTVLPAEPTEPAGI